MCSAERLGAAVDVARNGCVDAARGVTTTVAPLVRTLKARAERVSIVFLEMTLVGNAASIW